MFTALRQRNSTRADLARLLAGWLVAVLLLQGQAALLALVHGPAHRHVATSLGAADPAHWEAHQRTQAHHPGAEAGVVPADAEAALDAAACVLAAALAPLAVAYGWVPPVALTSRLGATAAWAFVDSITSPPRKPPRI